MPTTAMYPDTSKTRVWLFRDRAGPAHEAAYQACMKAGAMTKPKGEPTIVTCPSTKRFGAFEVVDKIPGEVGLPEVTLTARYIQDQSELLRALNRGCDIDMQLHVGHCKDPQSLNEGWEKIVALVAAQPGDYSVADFGALEQGDQAPILEEMTFRGEELYEILKVVFQEQATTETELEVIAIVICDAISCGDCEDPSDGCEKVFALTASIGASPGGRAEIIYTGDGGRTWGDRDITTLPAGRDPNDLACVGDNLVVISADENSLHYAPKADILQETETWTEVTTGFEAVGSPLAIFSLSPRHTWIVGENGYVYFTEDPTAGVTVQSPGSVTVENLEAIHGYDFFNLVAVGENDAIIVTENGGATWAAAPNTPAVGTDIQTVWMRGIKEWFVGYDDGTVWYTVDAGLNWTQKVLPGQTALANTKDIKFSNSMVGWIAADTGSAGRILRSIDGGNSWYVAPEGNKTLPANDRINEIAVCNASPNVVYAGGLAENATDGIIVKGA